MYVRLPTYLFTYLPTVLPSYLLSNYLVNYLRIFLLLYDTDVKLYFPNLSKRTYISPVFLSIP